MSRFLSGRMEMASEINLKVLKLVHHKLLMSLVIKTKEVYFVSRCLVT